MIQLAQSYQNKAGPTANESHWTAVLYFCIYTVKFVLFLKKLSKKKNSSKKWKAGSRKVCKVWLVLFVASSLHLTSLWNIFCFMSPSLLFSVHYNPEADSRVGGWEVRREGREGRWEDPVCSSGFGSIREGRGGCCLCGSPRISVSRSAFCLELSSSGRLPLSYLWRTDEAI